MTGVQTCALPISIALVPLVVRLSGPAQTDALAAATSALSGRLVALSDLRSDVVAAVNAAEMADGSRVAPIEWPKDLLDIERWRAEFEVGLWESVLAGVSLDGGAGLRVTPRVEWATRAPAWICGAPCLVSMGPSWSVGAGAPIALDGSGAVGVRGLAGVQWGLVGLVLAADTWPGTQRARDLSALLRLSL